MKFISSPLMILAAGALLASPVLADSVTLKSGDVYNGKVTRETETTVVMDVIVAAGITDEKSFDKADIKEVSKTTADSKVFETLKTYSVGPYSYAAATYPAMEKPLETFIAEHADSPHVPAVQTMLDTLKAEEERVKAGELKWDNRWYTTEEAQKNQYHLDAAMRLGQMKAQVARRDFIGALNNFITIEKTYPGSTSYPEAVELAQNTINAAAAEADRLQAAGKLQESQFKANIDYVPEPQKSQMLAAWKGQVASAERALALAEKSNLTWKPLLPLAPKSFEAFKSTSASERTRLSALPLASMLSSANATGQAEEALLDKKLDVADTKLKEAAKLWPANLRVKDLNAELALLKKPKPTPTPIPAASASPEKEKKGKH